MTQCVAEQLAATTDPYGPVSPPGFIWLGCVTGGKTTCEGVRACANGGEQDTVCEASDDADFLCNGNVALQCEGTSPGGVQQIAIDCSKLGMTCRTNVGCEIGKCFSTTNLEPPTCQGNIAGSCYPLTKVDGGYEGYFIPETNCPDFGGSTCQDSASGCVGPGQACTDDRCDGTTLVSCIGGHEARIGCTQYGLTCVSDADPDTVFDSTKSAFCGLGTECGADYPDSCKGGILTYCDAGKVATLDCVSAGWARCIKDENGPRCSP